MGGAFLFLLGLVFNHRRGGSSPAKSLRKLWIRAEKQRKLKLDGNQTFRGIPFKNHLFQTKQMHRGQTINDRICFLFFICLCFFLFFFFFMFGFCSYFIFLRTLSSGVSRTLHFSSSQRTPWGGVEKRGVGRLTSRRTPLQKQFWTPFRLVRFSPPSGVVALFFLYRNPRLSTPGALLEGFENLSAGCAICFVFLTP